MYESLLSEAYKEQVEVIYLPFSGNIKGLYCNNIIAINCYTPTTAERACILAEELGHYYTSVGNILDQTLLPNQKQELRARRWGYERLVPLNKLVLLMAPELEHTTKWQNILMLRKGFLFLRCDTTKKNTGFTKKITKGLG